MLPPTLFYSGGGTQLVFCLVVDLFGFEMKGAEGWREVEEAARHKSFHNPWVRSLAFEHDTHTPRSFGLFLISK